MQSNTETAPNHPVVVSQSVNSTSTSAIESGNVSGMSSKKEKTKEDALKRYVQLLPKGYCKLNTGDVACVTMVTVSDILEVLKMSINVHHSVSCPGSSRIFGLGWGGEGK